MIELEYVLMYALDNKSFVFTIGSFVLEGVHILFYGDGISLRKPLCRIVGCRH